MDKKAASVSSQEELPSGQTEDGSTQTMVDSLPSTPQKRRANAQLFGEQDRPYVYYQLDATNETGGRVLVSPRGREVPTSPRRLVNIIAGVSVPPSVEQPIAVADSETRSVNEVGMSPPQAGLPLSAASPIRKPLIHAKRVCAKSKNISEVPAISAQEVAMPPPSPNSKHDGEQRAAPPPLFLPTTKNNVDMPASAWACQTTALSQAPTNTHPRVPHPAQKGYVTHTPPTSANMAFGSRTAARACPLLMPTTVPSSPAQHQRVKPTAFSLPNTGAYNPAIFNSPQWEAAPRTAQRQLPYSYSRDRAVLWHLSDNETNTPQGVSLQSVDLAKSDAQRKRSFTAPPAPLSTPATIRGQALLPHAGEQHRPILTMDSLGTPTSSSTKPSLATGSSIQGLRPRSEEEMTSGKVQPSYVGSTPTETTVSPLPDLSQTYRAAFPEAREAPMDESCRSKSCKLYQSSANALCRYCHQALGSSNTKSGKKACTLQSKTPLKKEANKAKKQADIDPKSSSSNTPEKKKPAKHASTSKKKEPAKKSKATNVASSPKMVARKPKLWPASDVIALWEAQQVVGADAKKCRELALLMHYTHKQVQRKLKNINPPKIQPAYNFKWTPLQDMLLLAAYCAHEHNLQAIVYEIELGIPEDEVLHHLRKLLIRKYVYDQARQQAQSSETVGIITAPTWSVERYHYDTHSKNLAAKQECLVDLEANYSRCHDVQEIQQYKNVVGRLYPDNYVRFQYNFKKEEQMPFINERLHLTNDINDYIGYVMYIDHHAKYFDVEIISPIQSPVEFWTITRYFITYIRMWEMIDLFRDVNRSTMSLNNIYMEGALSPSIRKVLAGAYVLDKPELAQAAAECPPRELRLGQLLVAEDFSKLNAGQQRAICNSFKNSVTLIQGPPGTGKTFALVELARLLVRSFRRTDTKTRNQKLMIVADSNAAVDNIVECFAHVEASEPSTSRTKFLRYGQDIFAEDLKEYHIDQELTKHKISSDPGATQDVKWSILSAIDSVITTCSAAGSRFLKYMKFPIVILDEAGQTTVSSSLCAIVHWCQALILVGDHQQLRPVVRCQQAKELMEISIFEYLINAGLKPSLLNIQYRMDPAISEFPSWKWYNSQLQNACATYRYQPIGAIKWPQYENRCFPVLFFHVEGEMTREGHSKSNLNQCQVVAHLIQLITASNAVDIRKIAVLAAYAAQVELLKTKLHSYGPQLAISSVDSFQGHEAELVIYCTVRNSAYGAGFLKDERRMCVALTRARRGLIIIGHRGTLALTGVWQEWFSWADARQLVEPWSGSQTEQACLALPCL